MESIACYGRVSTADQSLARQVRSVLPYAERQFGATVNQEVDDVAEYVADEETSDDPVDLGGVTLYYDRATGTNTSREGYQEMMAAVQTGDVNTVITHSVSRISRSIRDLDRTAERIVEESGAELHIVSEGFRLLPEESDPYQKAMFQLLGVFAELEAEMAQQRAREGISARLSNDEYHHGPAPLGFEKDDGRLLEAANFDHVASVLSMVIHGEVSKRQAARELDTSRRTINRAIDDRAELYGLDDLREKIAINHKCEVCGADGGRTELHTHHTSYRDDETVPVCRRCHTEIHTDNGRYEELMPDLSQEEAIELGYAPTET